MRTVFTLACILAVFAANAQPPPAEQPLESQTASRLGRLGPRVYPEVRSNELVKGNVIYSGIVVGLLKTGNPLKLINPPAPPQYGPPKGAVTRGWSSGPIGGFTLFAIRF
jgi:hypothetical protein